MFPVSIFLKAQLSFKKSQNFHTSTSQLHHEADLHQNHRSGLETLKKFQVL